MKVGRGLVASFARTPPQRIKEKSLLMGGGEGIFLTGGLVLVLVGTGYLLPTPFIYLLDYMINPNKVRVNNLFGLISRIFHAKQGLRVIQMG